MLTPASPADIPFIMKTERLPGYEEWLGRWEATAHETAMTRSDHAYFIAQGGDGTAIGFAMLQDLDDPHGNVLFRRIAVTQPGQGHGAWLFRAATDWAFRETTVHRLYLHVYPHNERAIRLYRAQGFVKEGTEREGRLLADGRRVDVMTLSLLRREWEARMP
ncbi:MAG TPA: GNAT family protein [Acidisoma sp.]|uniref:GNAT family N-acetyltransferase n=1 Tax=Acidisoma sp. TaxID=1872115 RepID=UPI002CFF89AD|nr:GNAT family protein [Acidisoma sp.]HTI02583.1 GNAT family protein [Acidisoma sp.]